MPHYPATPIRPNEMKHRDADDICGTCAGSGIERYASGTGNIIIESCESCGGTGRRKCLIFQTKKPEDKL